MLSSSGDLSPLFDPLDIGVLEQPRWRNSNFGFWRCTSFSSTIVTIAISVEAIDICRKLTYCFCQYFLKFRYLFLSVVWQVCQVRAANRFDNGRADYRRGNEAL